MIEFQRIEDALRICISAMIGRSRTVGEMVTCEMSYRAKASTFSALFLHLLRAESLPDDVVQLIQRLHWAEQQRNILAHSLWDASEKQPETIRREKRVIRKKCFVVSEEHLTPDDLAELSGLFEGISTDLFYLTNKYLQGLKRRLW